MVTNHFGVCRHHQLYVARVRQEALAPARGFAVCVGGVAFITVFIIYCGSERVQLLSHAPSAFQSHRPPGLLCFRRRKTKQVINVEVD